MKKTQRYFELKQLIKDSTMELKSIEQTIIKQIFDTDDDKVVEDFATFSMGYRAKWKYSDELTTQESNFKEKLKALKKIEELNGKAEKITDGGFLRMTINKEDK